MSTTNRAISCSRLQRKQFRRRASSGTEKYCLSYTRRERLLIILAMHMPRASSIFQGGGQCGFAYKIPGQYPLPFLFLSNVSSLCGPSFFESVYYFHKIFFRRDGLFSYREHCLSLRSEMLLNVVSIIDGWLRGELLTTQIPNVNWRRARIMHMWKYIYFWNSTGWANGSMGS